MTRQPNNSYVKDRPTRWWRFVNAIGRIVDNPVTDIVLWSWGTSIPLTLLVLFIYGGEAPLWAIGVAAVWTIYFGDKVRMAVKRKRELGRYKREVT